MDNCSKDNCTLPVENKKYKLCKVHNWERTHPGKDYFSEQIKKNQGYQDKMREKQLSKPKKEFQFKQLAPKVPFKIVEKSFKEFEKKQNPIRQFSKKREKLNSVYTVVRKEYMEVNPNCEVIGCQCEATEIHHKKGKQGYADKWARDNEIHLLIDKRWFMSVCGGLGGHHRKIEDNPEWAREMGYSLHRTENLDQ